MRFAEKMLLGSTLIPWAAYTLGISGEPGCALGMVVAAEGDQEPQRHIGLLKYGHWSYGKADVPCGCRIDLRHLTVFGVLIHIFNVHVMGDRTWTIERLADWVDQFEPRETEPAPEPALEQEPVLEPAEAAQ